MVGLGQVITAVGCVGLGAKMGWVGFQKGTYVQLCQNALRQLLLYTYGDVTSL